MRSTSGRLERETFVSLTQPPSERLTSTTINRRLYSVQRYSRITDEFCSVADGHSGAAGPDAQSGLGDNLGRLSDSRAARLPPRHGAATGGLSRGRASTRPHREPQPNPRPQDGGAKCDNPQSQTGEEPRPRLYECPEATRDKRLLQPLGIHVPEE